MTEMALCITGGDETSTVPGRNSDHVERGRVRGSRGGRGGRGARGRGSRGGAADGKRKLSAEYSVSLGLHG